MSQRAFIVKLNIDDSVDAGEIAADIQEGLVSDGYAVISVEPWKAQEAAQGLAESLGLGQTSTEDVGLGVAGVNGIGGL